MACNFAKNEHWTVQLYSAGAFRVIEQGTGDCLVVSNGSASAAAPLVQQPCSGTQSLLGLVLIPGPAFVNAQNPSSIQIGQDLYTGKESLKGRIRGHEDLLPASAVICANCHSPQSTSRLSSKPASQLNRAWLTEMRQRHGGPPSAYTQASFCKVLRAGTDPVFILVDREMPIYEMNESQCASLWSYLTAKEPVHDVR